MGHEPAVCRPVAAVRPLAHSGSPFPRAEQKLRPNPAFPVLPLSRALDTAPAAAAAAVAGYIHPPSPPRPHHLAQCGHRITELAVGEIGRRTEPKHLAARVHHDSAGMERGGQAAGVR